MGDAGVRAVVLGAAQDGGRPQVGCDCRNCRLARTEPGEAEGPSSLAIVDDRAHRFWILDLTPDFARQFDWLRETLGAPYTFSGAVLTHAHIGHYLGILQLGREVMSTREVPIYGSAAMMTFLRTHGPFSQLVSLGNIRLMPLPPDVPERLAEDIEITLTPVPHRQEWSDTMAITVRGPQRSLMYLPDIDRWDLWDRPIRDVVKGVDLAFLDATFFDEEELPGRDRAEIPHPTVVETLAALGPLPVAHPSRVQLIHLNHSNPLWEREKAASLKQKGVTVARRGDVHWL